MGLHFSAYQKITPISFDTHSPRTPVWNLSVHGRIYTDMEKGGVYMAKKLILTMFLVLVLLTVIPQLAVAASQNPIHFCANSGNTGCSTTFSNKGAFNSIEFTKVDPSVKRLQIMDSKSRKVLFDKLPVKGLTINLPKGEYTAIGWASKGKLNHDAVEAVLSETTQKKLEKAPVKPAAEEKAPMKHPMEDKK